MEDRLFIGVFPGGISYADRAREKHGDYAKLAFLDYAFLVLKVEPDCPADLRARIEKDAAEIQAKKGEQYQTSSTGQTVLLGSALIEQEKYDAKSAQWQSKAQETLGPFIEMADGWSVSGPSTVWLYFLGEKECRQTAAALKAAGHRRLEAFPSPEHAGSHQLNYTMTVELRQHLRSERADGLEALIRDLGIDPVAVMDLRDGSYVIEFDAAEDEAIFKSYFVPAFRKVAEEKAQDLIVEPHQRWAKDHLGLTAQYRLTVKEKQIANV